MKSKNKVAPVEATIATKPTKVTKTANTVKVEKETIVETPAPAIEAAPIVEAVKKQRGRPVIVGSTHYNKLKRWEDMRAEGKEVKRGRPTVEGSTHAIKKARLEEARTNGTLKLGRPKMEKVETPVVEETVVA